MSKRTVQQIDFPQGAEILAVDPDQINAAPLVDPGGGFVENGVDHFRSIGHGNPVDGQIVPFLENLADVLIDVRVDDVGAAPHKPVDGCAFGFGQNLLPPVEAEGGQLVARLGGHVGQEKLGVIRAGQA